MTEVVAVAVVVVEAEAENEGDHFPVEAPGVIVVAEVGVEIKVIVGQEVRVVQK